MSKIAVINGANRGIGLALTEKLLAEGYKVWALCRKTSPQLAATSAKVISDVDITSLTSIERASKEITDGKVDLVVNVAGISRQDGLENLGASAFAEIAEQFQVNALAALQFCSVLYKKLGATGKLVLITSRMGSIEDNTSGGRYGYRASKAALNMFGKSLAIDLKGAGISVGILHPGFIQTDMTGGRGDRGPAECAEMLFARINALSLENSGQFWHANGDRLPW